MAFVRPRSSWLRKLSLIPAAARDLLQRLPAQLPDRPQPFAQLDLDGLRRDFSHLQWWFSRMKRPYAREPDVRTTGAGVGTEPVQAIRAARARREDAARTTKAPASATRCGGRRARAPCGSRRPTAVDDGRRSLHRRSRAARGGRRRTERAQRLRRKRGRAVRAAAATAPSSPSASAGEDPVRRASSDRPVAGVAGRRNGCACLDGAERPGTVARDVDRPSHRAAIPRRRAAGSTAAAHPPRAATRSGRAAHQYPAVVRRAEVVEVRAGVRDRLAPSQPSARGDPGPAP